MTYVIVREKEIRRPIRFEHRRFESLFAELVFVGVDQIGIAMSLQKFHDLEQRIRLDNVVVVEQSHPFPAGELESPIRRSRNTSVFSETRQGDAPIARGKVRQDAEQIRIG